MSNEKLLLDPEHVLPIYHKHAGNKTKAAAELGIHRGTLRQMLEMWGITKPVVGGTAKALKHNILPLPEEGKVFRYILSCAQNNTKVFAKFLHNLERYRDWLGDCRIMVARLCYNKSSWSNPKSQKPGGIKAEDADELWFDPLIAPYISDDPELHGTCRWQLAPDLWWCSEMQLDVTAVRPLSDLKTYTGTDSAIFPHTKLAIEPVATVPGLPTKHCYTTGTLTYRNYIQKKAGLKAEFHHVYSAVLVEVDSNGDWWARHIVADGKGEFFDCPRGEVVKVTKDGIQQGLRAEALNWGDIHVTELPEDRMYKYWGQSSHGSSVIDSLKPKYQFFNDLFSMKSRSHHEMHSFADMLKKHIRGTERIDAELQKTADFLSLSERPDTLSVVVQSNHDRHLERYLDEVNYKHDLVNVLWFLEAQLARVKAIQSGDDGWLLLEWALQRQGCPEAVRFLRMDESFVVCKSNHPIECGLHGDIGPNGARGTVNNLSVLGSRVTKGHDHSLSARDGLWSAGVCSPDQDYRKGPGTWSVSHVVTYPSGKRAGLTERVGKLWA